MIEIVKLYEKISLEIIECINKSELDKVDSLLNKRQEILESEINKSELKKILIDKKILDIDKKIYNLLSENIDKVKEEIKEHKVSKQANNNYSYFNKEKLNIFNKKV
ncbi:flagellar protein FliT [Clostridium sp. CCUG 7971]|uniref:flagellar protein FliT n=1 Tax=Clostridium sp. CCUG 7971 TaxID=2811414 RepID=UPI001ABB1C09|nr:flagellar protein FliT [Clostridium sp. CCUG 7971]MBO3446333.1 flagellar protein FliT [Clostridium sp. CCUG 7971]